MEADAFLNISIGWRQRSPMAFQAWLSVISLISLRLTFLALPFAFLTLGIAAASSGGAAMERWPRGRETPSRRCAPRGHVRKQNGSSLGACADPKVREGVTAEALDKEILDKESRAWKPVELQLWNSNFGTAFQNRLEASGTPIPPTL